jgi:hypothetical protein
MGASMRINKARALAHRRYLKHEPYRDTSQTSLRMSSSKGGALQRNLSSCTPERINSPEIRNLASDTLLPSIEHWDYQLGHTGDHASPEGRPQYCYTDGSDPATSRISSPSPLQTTDVRVSGLTSPLQALPDPLIIPQVTMPHDAPAPASDYLHGFTQPLAPPQSPLPPSAMHGFYSLEPYPAKVPLAHLPRYISYIDEATVRNHLAVAVVRHRDIHDMVETEWERVTQEAQGKSVEDASILSFVKEHAKVQKILYQEYEDLTNSKRQEIAQMAFTTINQIISDIPPRVRPTSSWRTKFNAFLALTWIGRAIVDGLGMLPNAIRARMAFDSTLILAIEEIYMTMSETEILDDGTRLMEALLDLSNGREHCFQGLEKIVDDFREVTRRLSVL